MHSIALAGCHPNRLASYLKSLGILRLIHEQAQPRVTGYWYRQSNRQTDRPPDPLMAKLHRSEAQSEAKTGSIPSDVFVLNSQLAADDLIHFFLHQYQPTPFLAPWNGSTGFYPKDNAKTLDSIRHSTTSRFALYREAISIAQEVVDEMELKKQPTGVQKTLLVRHLRDRLPDLAVRWIDTCTLVSDRDIHFPPLLGTGGNDGNFEFSRTFQQQLKNLLDFASGEPTANSETLLRAALFGEVLPGLEFSGKIGQFDPIAAGGANAAPGFEGKSRVNPWDFVLMLEGTLTFQTRLTRKFESASKGALTYPFTVRATPMGYGTAAEDEGIRAETWLPIWSKPARFDELQHLFGEGRAKLGAHQKTGVDFALAIADLGKFRGLDAFMRYSFQERNGLSYFAVPLGEFRPHEPGETNLLAQLEWWLDRFRQTQSDSNNPPAAVRRVYRLLETRLVEFAQSQGQPGPSKHPYLSILMALGEVEKTLNRSLTWVRGIKLPPIPELNGRWIGACNDESREFRLALALAHRGLYSVVVHDKDSSRQALRLVDYPDGDRGLRQRLAQVRYNGDYKKWDWADPDGITIWQGGSLLDKLLALLQREELESRHHKKAQDTSGTNGTPRTSERTARLEDIQAWIEGQVDDERLEAIARGLALVNRHPHPTSTSTPTEAVPVTPITFRLLEPVIRRVVTPMTEEGTPSATDRVELPHVPGLHRRLAAGDCLGATKLAVQRLRASGVHLRVKPLYESPERTRRIAAALAFPITERDSQALLSHIYYRDPDRDLD